MARRPTLTCSGCDKPMWTGGRGTKPQGEARCNACRGRDCDVACLVCGATFRRRYASHVYCSRACMGDGNAVRAGREPRKPIPCPVCGIMFRPVLVPLRGERGKALAGTCGRSCGQTLRRAAEVAARQAEGRDLKAPRSKDREWWPVYFPTCPECGTLFCARSKARKLCGDACQDARRLRATLARYAEDPAFRDDVLARAHARRVDKLGLGPSKRVVFSFVGDRDGWVCQLCRLPVDRDATVRSLKPSLDHVLPVSRGGRHELGNVQLAHVLCNLSKGNRDAPSPAALARVAALVAGSVAP